MAKANASGHKAAEAKQFMNQLATLLIDLKPKLTKLKTDIESIERGKDGKQAYWSGLGAVKYIGTLKKHYNNHVGAYNAYVIQYKELESYFHKSSIQLGK